VQSVNIKIKNAENKKKVLLTVFISGTMLVAAQTTTTDEGVVINGVKWATRNLAAQGTFVNNPEDQGGLFQWGRKGDGHEQRTSSVTMNYSETSTPGHANFILTTDFTSYDWIWVGKNDLWNSGTEAAPAKAANDPCPAGWRVPAYTEFASLRNAHGAYKIINGINGRMFGSGDNTIFLPLAGYRSYDDGHLNNGGIYGYYWSSTAMGIYSGSSYYFHFGSTYVAPNYDLNTNYRSCGYSVRCVSERATTTNINNIPAKKEENILGYYNIMGQKLTKEPASGIYIILYDNRTTEKRVQMTHFCR